MAPLSPCLHVPAPQQCHTQPVPHTPPGAAHKPPAGTRQVTATRTGCQPVQHGWVRFEGSDFPQPRPKKHCSYSFLHWPLPSNTPNFQKTKHNRCSCPETLLKQKVWRFFLTQRPRLSYFKLHVSQQKHSEQNVGCSPKRVYVPCLRKAQLILLQLPGVLFRETPAWNAPESSANQGSSVGRDTRYRAENSKWSVIIRKSMKRKRKGARASAKLHHSVQHTDNVGSTQQTSH